MPRMASVRGKVWHQPGLPTGSARFPPVIILAMPRRIREIVYTRVLTQVGNTFLVTSDKFPVETTTDRKHFVLV